MGNRLRKAAARIAGLYVPGITELNLRAMPIISSAFPNSIRRVRPAQARTPNRQSPQGSRGDPGLLTNGCQALAMLARDEMLTPSLSERDWEAASRRFSSAAREPPRIATLNIRGPTPRTSDSTPRPDCRERAHVDRRRQPQSTRAREQFHGAIIQQGGLGDDPIGPNFCGAGFPA